MYGSSQSFGRLSALALGSCTECMILLSGTNTCDQKKKRNVDLLLYIREQLYYIILLYMICNITPMPHPSYPLAFLQAPSTCLR